jgi:hypothetical protein
MTRVKARRERFSDKRQDARSFGVRDEKGREIGGYVEVWTEFRRPLTEEEMSEQQYSYYSCFPEDLGVRYAYRPGALRNGCPFGAWQREQFFATAEERDRAVEQYFANARKRAAKRASA